MYLSELFNLPKLFSEIVKPSKIPFYLYKKYAVLWLQYNNLNFHTFMKTTDIEICIVQSYFSIDADVI